MKEVLQSRYVLADDLIIRGFEWGSASFEFYQRGWWSRIYEYQWMLDACKAYFDDFKGKSALDIATGVLHPGMFLLKSLGFDRVVGTDLFDVKDHLFVKEIKDGIEYVKESVMHPTMKDKFDCVSCISFLEHIPNYQQEFALENILSYVSEDGCAIFTFDIPGYDFQTDLPLYESVLKKQGFYFSNVEVDAKKILTTTNSPVAAQDLKGRGISCYRLFAGRKPL